MSWEHNDVLALIEMYKESPELWDFEHCAYHNGAKSEKIYRSMAARFNKSTYDVKAKLKSLRCMYLRQHKKVKQRQRKTGGCSWNNILWFGYKPMSFLEKVYDKKRLTKSEEVEEEGDTMDSCEESNLDQEFVEESDNDDDNSIEMMWTRDDVIKLIGMYKEYPILWNTDHPNYHHKQMRLKVMKLIAESFNTSIPEIKNKVKNIRTMFLNMHKKVKSTIEQDGKWSGKVWYGYKMMEFLVKEGIPNIDQTPSPSDPSWRREFDNDESLDVQENISKSHWDQRDFLKLIKLYESQKLLWDPKNADYNNRFARLESIQSLAHLLNKPRQEVESKIRNLRTQFFKNHKRIQDMIRADGRVTGKVWFGYKPMMFLANFSERKQGSHDHEKIIVKKEHFYYEDDNDSHVSTNSNEMLEIEMPIKHEKKKRKYSEGDDSDDPLEFLSNNSKMSGDNIIESKTDHIINSKSKSDDEISVFGQFITQELKKIKDEYALIMAKKQISEIVFQAQIHQASVSTKKTDSYEETNQQ